MSFNRHRSIPITCTTLPPHGVGIHAAAKALATWSAALALALAPGCLAEPENDGEGDEVLASRTGLVGAPSRRKSAKGLLDTGTSTDVAWTDPTWSSSSTCHNAGRFEVWENDGSTWLDNAADEEWNRDTASVEDIVGCDDYFGAALVLGDFDNDAYADLVVGAPGDSVSGTSNVGSVHAFYGSSTGITATDDDPIYQDEVGQTNEASDYWGEVLAVGNFDGDGYDDLAIGAPREDIGSLTDAGAVIVVYGSSSGLAVGTAEAWHQDQTGVEGAAEAGDECGGWIAVGDFDDDGYDDLAFSCPGENIGSVSNAGAVNVIYGSASGLDVTGDQLWYQDVGALEGTPDADDEFGGFMAIIDHNSDGIEDLAVTVKDGCAYSPVNQQVILGGSTGLTDASDVLICVDPSAVTESCTDPNPDDYVECECTDSALDCFGWLSGACALDSDCTLPSPCNPDRQCCDQPRDHHNYMTVIKHLPA